MIFKYEQNHQIHVEIEQMWTNMVKPVSKLMKILFYSNKTNYFLMVKKSTVNSSM